MTLYRYRPWTFCYDSNAIIGFMRMCYSKNGIITYEHRGFDIFVSQIEGPSFRWEVWRRGPGCANFEALGTSQNPDTIMFKTDLFLLDENTPALLGNIVYNVEEPFIFPDNDL